MVVLVPSNVPVGQTSYPLISISSNSVSSNVSSLGIATYTRVSSVLMLLRGGSIESYLEGGGVNRQNLKFTPFKSN
jgi:hypothetical protein